MTIEDAKNLFKEYENALIKIMDLQSKYTGSEAQIKRMRKLESQIDSIKNRMINELTNN